MRMAGGGGAGAWLGAAAGACRHVRLHALTRSMPTGASAELVYSAYEPPCTASCAAG